MAKNHEINVKVNAKGTKDADKAFKGIKKGLKDIETQAKKSFSADNVKKVNQEIKNTTKVTLDVRQRLRDLQNKMAEIGDVGSAEFQALAKEAGTLKDQMNNANSAIKSMSADFPKLQVGVEAIGAMGAGAQVATASMSLFGSENEDVTRSIQKMMAIQALMNASLQVANMLSDESAIGLAIRKLRTEALSKSNGKNTAGMMVQILAQRGLNGAQKAGAVTMRVLNNVMKANPIFLLIGLIGGLVGAFKLFSKSAETAQESMDKYNETLEKQIALNEQIKSTNQDKMDMYLREAKLNGKTEEEIFKLKKKFRDINEENRKIDLVNEESNLKNLEAIKKKFEKERNAEEVKNREKEIQATKFKIEQLKLLEKDYRLDIREMDAEEAKRIEKANEKAVSDSRARGEKRKARMKEIADFKRATEDMELANKEKTLDNELDAQMVRFKREEDELQKSLDSNKITKEMHNTRKLALEEQYRLERNNIVKKYDDQEKALLDQAEKDKEAKDKERLDKKRQAEELRISRIPDDKERELALENLAYQRKLESAQGHKQLLAELELQHNAKIKEINDAHDAQVLLDKQANFQAQAEAMSNYAGMASSGLQSIASLDAVLMENKMAKVKGNTQAEEKLRKESFKRQKALNLNLAIIDGFKSILTSLAQSPIAIGPAPNPMGIASLAFASISAGTNIAKILATKYQGGGGSKPSVGSVPRGGASPQFNVVGNSPQNQLAQSLGESNDEPVQAFVVSSEVTSAQSMDRNIVETASL